MRTHQRQRGTKSTSGEAILEDDLPTPAAFECAFSSSFPLGFSEQKSSQGNGYKQLGHHEVQAQSVPYTVCVPIEINLGLLGLIIQPDL